MKNEDLIHLQHANMFQLTKDGKKHRWIIRKNITKEEIATLPAEITDEQMFIIMRFARKFELDAFNAGIAHGKKLQSETQRAVVNGLQERLRLATEENLRIASLLDKLEGAETDGSSTTH